MKYLTTKQLDRRDANDTSAIVFNAIFTFSNGEQSAGMFGCRMRDFDTEQAFRACVIDLLKSVGEKRKLKKASLSVDISASKAGTVTAMFRDWKRLRHWFKTCRGKLFFD